MRGRTVDAAEVPVTRRALLSRGAGLVHPGRGAPLVVEAADVLPSRDGAEALIARVLTRAARGGADAARVSLAGRYAAHARVAAGALRHTGTAADLSVRVECRVGARRAAVTTNALDDEGLGDAIDRCVRLARLLPEDRDAPAFGGAVDYVAVPAWSARTASLTADDRARAVGAVLAAARARDGLEASALVTTALEVVAVATSAGGFGWHRGTSAAVSVTVRTADGTGSSASAADAVDWDELDAGALARRAAQRARLSRNPVRVEPGRWTVLLEPHGTSRFVDVLPAWLQAPTVASGRSPFSGVGPGGARIGERVADARVTIYSDPADPLLLAAPFDATGAAQRRTPWIEAGVLRALIPAGPFPTSFAMAGEPSATSDAAESLAAGVERALLCTRIYYVRPTDLRTGGLTGVTRDGTFLVEGGRIVRAVRNLRFNASALAVLANVEALGRARRLGVVLPLAPGATKLVLAAPPSRVRDFPFTSASDAV